MTSFVKTSLAKAAYEFETVDGREKELLDALVTAAYATAVAFRMRDEDALASCLRKQVEAVDAYVDYCDLVVELPEESGADE